VLVPQFGGAFLVLRVAGAFGFVAAEARTIGLGLFRRPVPFRALPESVQIDGFPHDHLHQPNGWYRGRILRQRKFSRTALDDSVFIIKNPHRPKIQESHFALRKRHIFVLYHDAMQRW
jgi:hypothetical protein